MDKIISGMARGNEIRFFAADTRDTVEKSREIHNTSPICTAALGRLLTAGSMMAAMMKNEDDVLTLSIDCDGPAKGLTVTADAHLNVKCIIKNPLVIMSPNAAGHLNVGGAIGRGTLSVIRDEGIAQPYVGRTQLVSGEIAEDITYYYAESEQIPTSVGLGVLMSKDNTVKRAGGFIIQLLPFASDETISFLEDRLAAFSSVTTFLDTGADIEDMMKALLGDDLTIEQTRETQYKCNCSRERVTKALISIGREEIDEMIKDGEVITLNCEFCDSHYTFSIDELKEIRKNM